MYETPEDLQAFDKLLTDSIVNAGAFLRSSFEMPEKSLSALQLCRYLEGVQTVALATITSKGEPRVAPIGSFIYRGRFHIPTTMESARVRHIRRRSSVSLTLFEGIDFAVIVHGNAEILDAEHPDFDELEAIHREHSGASVRDWGEGAFLRIEAAAFYSFARYPDRFPA